MTTSSDSPASVALTSETFKTISDGLDHAVWLLFVFRSRLRDAGLYDRECEAHYEARRDAVLGALRAVSEAKR